MLDMGKNKPCLFFNDDIESMAWTPLGEEMFPARYWSTPVIFDGRLHLFVGKPFANKRETKWSGFYSYNKGNDGEAWNNCFRGE